MPPGVICQIPEGQYFVMAIGTIQRQPLLGSVPEKNIMAGRFSSNFHLFQYETVQPGHEKCAAAGFPARLIEAK